VISIKYFLLFNQEEEFMAAVSFLPPPIVYRNDIQVGEITIPIGDIRYCHLYQKDASGKNIHEVRVWTSGAMGLNGEEVIIHFSLGTAERANQFFRDLLKTSNASFAFYASLIKPDLIPCGAGVKGVINIDFPEDSYCQQFNSSAASVFFPEFEAEVLDGKKLRLTSNEGTENETIHKMNQAFAHLNQRTDREISLLLWRNGDLRFYAARSQKLGIAILTQGSFPRPHHYYVGDDGSVKKEIFHLGSPSANHTVHTIKEHEDTIISYSAIEPLPQPADISRANSLLTQTLEFIEKVSKISDKLAQKFTVFKKYLELERQRQTPRNDVEWEVLKNKIPSFIDTNFTELTPEEEDLIRTLLEELEQTRQKVAHDA
jgi:hypothetical protein